MRGREGRCRGASRPPRGCRPRRNAAGTVPLAGSHRRRYRRRCRRGARCPQGRGADSGDRRPGPRSQPCRWTVTTARRNAESPSGDGLRPRGARAGAQGVWPTCRRCATSLGWGLRPSRMARHGGHSHQSGRAAGCRVGSPSNSNRHRPHCWGGGPLSAGTQRVLGSTRCRSATPTRVSGKWGMMPPLVGVLRGGIGLVRPEAWSQRRKRGDPTESGSGWPGG